MRKKKKTHIPHEHERWQIILQTLYSMRLITDKYKYNLWTFTIYGMALKLMNPHVMSLFLKERVNIMYKNYA